MMFYSYVVNNTQAKNEKEKIIEKFIQDLHLVIFQKIDDVENFMDFVNEFILEKNALFKKTKPLKLELVVFEKIKGDYFMTCNRADMSCFFTIRIQKLNKLWVKQKTERVVKFVYKQ